MEHQIIKDLETVTSVSEQILTKILVEDLMYIICQDVSEDLQAEEEMSELDLGIGKLYIKQIAGEIKYKFIPSQKFNSELEKTFKDKLNSMDKAVNAALAKKFMAMYKDLC